MTVTALGPATLPAVTITAGAVSITNLTVTHAEAAVIAAATLEQSGQQALEDLVRRALPVGLLALSMGSAAVDTGSMQRTLDAFAEQVDRRSGLALDGLNNSLQRLREGELAVATTAQAVLARLPEQIQAVLGGEADNVRASVTEAARTVQATGLQDLQAALALHATTVRNALSLDHEGPVQQLRQDVLGQLDSTRRELAGQLAGVRGLLQAAEAHKAGAARSTRAVGQAWEQTAMDGLAREVVVAAGDLYESTGSTPAPGGPGRAGDGLVTLTRAITGSGPKVHLLLEAKTRSRPLSAAAWRRELRSSMVLRQAVGALALVPTGAEVPGGGPLARVDDFCFVVAGDDPANVKLVYLILREMVALLAVRNGDDTAVDLVRAEAQLQLAMQALTEFDEVAKHLASARKSLDGLFQVAGNTRKKIHQALTEGLAALRQ